MPEEWFIDGYNLLHFLASSDSQASKTSRETMFQMLAGFAAAGDRVVLLVLDGKGSDEEFRPYQTKSFQVVYSQAVSADTYIERCLYQKKGQAILKVVTQDRAIAQLARGFGAVVVDLKEFMRLIKTIKENNKDTLFQNKVRAHGFHRPFQDKL